MIIRINNALRVLFSALSTDLCSRYSLVKIKIIIAVVVVILPIVFTNTCLAYWVERQKGTPVKKDFMLGPTSFKLKGSRGEVFKRELQVTNRLGKTMGFVVEVEDFTGSSNPAEPSVLYKGKGPFSARKWFKVEKQFFILKQGEKAHFMVTITIPEGADPGEHYAAVLVKTRNLEPPKKGVPTVRVSSRLGSMFLIDTGGKRIEKGSFVDFKVGQRLYNNGPVKFGLVVSNRGNTHLEPTGVIVIKNLLGRVTAKIPVRSWIVLRRSKRLQEAVFKRYWIFGEYTATAYIWWGSKKKYEKASLTFYGFPYQMALYIIVGILFAGFLADKLKQKYFSKYRLVIKVEKKE